MKNKLANLPSIVWVVIFPLIIIGVIGTIIFLFFALASVEGFASLIFIVIGLGFSISALRSPVVSKQSKEKSAGIFVAIGICFFALMGISVDQTGNVLYNKPLEIIFCPENTSLDRNEIVTNPLPGRTDITQNFSCYNSEGNVEKTIGMGYVILVRFIEYVILGYFFMYLASFIRFMKRRSLAKN